MTPQRISQLTLVALLSAVAFSAGARAQSSRYEPLDRATLESLSGVRTAGLWKDEEKYGYATKSWIIEERSVGAVFVTRSETVKNELREGMSARIETISERVFEIAPPQNLTMPPSAELSDAERQRHLERTERMPLGDKVIQFAARRRALGDTDAKKVKSLATWVAGRVHQFAFLFPEYDATDVLSEGCPDSEACALLFATLARAIGIPARMVKGLAYAGDRKREFVPRQWCEVYVESRWMSVDPFAGQFPADGSHIRCVSVPIEFLRTLEPLAGPRTRAL